MRSRLLIFVAAVALLSIAAGGMRTDWTPDGNVTRVGDKESGNFIEFDQYGRQIIAIGDSAVVWGDVAIAPTNIRQNPLTSKPDYIAYLAMMRSFSFDAATSESLFFQLEMPHWYKIGTDISMHINWMPTTTNTGLCAWKVGWMIMEDGGTAAFAATDTVSATQAGSGTILEHQHLDIGLIDMSGISLLSSVVTGYLTRDANLNSDTFTGEAIYGAIGFHYQMDSNGSRQSDSK